MKNRNGKNLFGFSIVVSTTKMEDQEWRKHARRYTTSHNIQVTNGVPSPRRGTSSRGASTPTIASSNKSILKQKESRTVGGNAASNSTVTPPSRWKEMRQAVRIKATIDTEDRRVSNARIADLCEEDREKVAKLIRRIVEVGTLHEESESEFQRQRTLMESEIHELRAHAKQDAHEIDELSDKLKASLEKLRDYQERVLVLEESNELEVKHRMETDQTVDLLKVEVDKLRKLVRKQRDEMELKEKELRQKHRDEMDQMAQELKETHELLLQERRERLADKQKELNERIQRSSVSPVATAHTATSAAPPAAQASTRAEANRYDVPEQLRSQQPSHGVQLPVRDGILELVDQRGRDGVSPLEISSFLNLSSEMPEKIKEIMNEWKTRMETALNTTAASISHERGIDKKPLVQTTVSTSCQTETEDPHGPRNGSRDESKAAAQPEPVRPKAHAHRREFDRFLTARAPTRRSQSPVSRSSSSSTNERAPRARAAPTNVPYPPPSSYHDERSVTRVLLDEFVQPSVLADDDESFEDEVESTIAIIDAMQSSSPSSLPNRGAHGHQKLQPPRNLSLYESSLYDVVRVVESSDEDSSPSRSRRATTFQNQEADSPTLRVERLLQGLRDREQKLARVSTFESEDFSFVDDVELFNQVKDVYEQHLDQGRREELLAIQNRDIEESDEYPYAMDPEYDSSAVASASARDRYVQDAIERDMEELLRQEGLPDQATMR